MASLALVDYLWVLMDSYTSLLFYGALLLPLVIVIAQHIVSHMTKAMKDLNGMKIILISVIIIRFMGSNAL